MNARQTSAKPGFIGIWFGMLVGIAVAGVITLLLNPQSGRENRATIKNRAIQAKEAIIWHARDEVEAVKRKNNGKKKH